MLYDRPLGTETICTNYNDDKRVMIIMIIMIAIISIELMLIIVL